MKRLFLPFLSFLPFLAAAQDFTVLPGFKVEQLYKVDKETEGSWVALCVDPKGSLIASDQYGGLYRINPGPIDQPDATQVQPIPLKIGKAHGLLWAFDSLYIMGGEHDVNDSKEQKASDKRSLWRARDTDNDGELDELKRIATYEGTGEHGPHALALSPDGKKIYVALGNHTPAPDFPKSLLPNKSWQEDHLLPRMWDARGHARGILAPGGFFARCNPDGSDLELVSLGYRNQYDFAFDQNGEMFTYDSDMEWDLGTPWYRPTRICHATSGSDLGWRSGSGVWPDYYPDSLPAVVDIGPGSPTGTVFGTGAKFPAKYQLAMFSMDWSFGTLYAIHFKPKGASYTADKEVFLARNPAPLSDLVVRPQDGALYFTVGGRKTDSALFRVIYTGTESTAPAPAPKLTEPQLLRREIEKHHRPGDAGALAAAWPHLDHADRHIRFAARTAVEHQPVAQWQEKALGETRPRALRELVMALARMSKSGQENRDENIAPRLVDRMLTQKWETLPVPERLEWLRAASLVFTRLGEPDAATSAKLLAALDASFPTPDDYVNRELANLLIYLKSPTVVAKAVEQMYTAKDPADVTFDEAHLTRGGGYGKVIAEMQKVPGHKQQIHYAFGLRNATTGWTPKLRDKYFAWFGPARLWKGGNSFPGFLTNTRDEALDKVTEPAEHQRLLALATNSGEKMKELPRPKGPGANYTAADFQGITLEALKKRDLANGKLMFEAALCAACHKFGTEGGVGGPDLTGSGARYTPANLLTAILDPDKEVSDQYAFTEFTLKDGAKLLGRVAREDQKELHLITTFLAPEAFTPLQKGKIKSQGLSKTSPMLPGLMNALNKEEALDLLAFLLLGAK